MSLKNSVKYCLTLPILDFSDVSRYEHKLAISHKKNSINKLFVRIMPKAEKVNSDM